MFDREAIDDFLLTGVQTANEANEAARAQTITVVGTAAGQVAIFDGTAYQPGSITGSGATGVAVTPTTSPFGLQVALTTVPVANGGTGATTAANARTNLGLGTIATQAQAAADANDTITPSAGYVQAEAVATVTELHDLKDKLRAAGIIAP